MIGKRIRIIKDLHANNPLDSLESVGIQIGDEGVVLEIFDDVDDSGYVIATKKTTAFVSAQEVMFLEDL